MRRSLTIAAVLILAAVLGAMPSRAAAARGLPAGFHDTVVWKGLNGPDLVRFAHGGKVFVGEQDGEILVYDGLHARKPHLVADLRRQVYAFQDTGLIGLAVDPHFPRRPYVYITYVANAAIGATAPRWHGGANGYDRCPTPPGNFQDGCETSGRLVRLTVRHDRAVASKVLINDWCNQYDQHSIGDLAFAPDGTLYVGGGDGGAKTTEDYGQLGGKYPGDRPNPCGNGVAQTLPGAQGGSLRAQLIGPSDGAPATLDGKLIRVDPATGAGVPGNPMASSPVPDSQRTIADGIRQPFRITFQPGTDRLWIADTGWNSWEEIDTFQLSGTAVPDYGWPCYEGPAPEPTWQSLGLTICANLYASGNTVAPYYAYAHLCPSNCPVHGPTNLHVAGRLCETGSAAITGISFYERGPFPRRYHGALFFADFDRGCLYVMPKGLGGQPDPDLVRPFDTAAITPTDLQRGPGGALYYASIGQGEIRKISYH